DFRLLLAIIAAWKDPRLNLKKFVAKDSVMFPSKLEKNLWKPKFVFLNTKMVEKFYDSSRITSVKVLPDESLFGGRHSDKEIQLKWMEEENSPYKNLGKSIHVRHMNLLTYEMDEIKAKKVTEQWLTGNHTLLIAEFKFKRRLTGNLMNVYIPSTLVVMLSWLSFWIDVHAAPARVTLGVTSILTLVTHLVQSRSFVPPVDYLKALDVWFIFCIVLIFLSLMEYALAYQSAIKMKE
ncbi:glycine receptor subunit alphaZ1-like, partial [Centruroides vittatus]|uniref:glycine receptor subunit alphaZ1-like n=1 Tax=Centruroides vittatus TaxID=120091 RepID=UPI00350EAB1C